MTIYFYYFYLLFYYYLFPFSSFKFSSSHYYICTSDSSDYIDIDMGVSLKSPRKKCRKWISKPVIVLPETQLPERWPQHLRLSQRHSASEESSDNSCLTWLCHTPETFSQPFHDEIDAEKQAEKEDVLETIHEDTNSDNRIVMNSSDNIKNSIQTNVGGVTVQDCLPSGSDSTTNSTKIPNAQPQNYNDMNPPNSVE